MARGAETILPGRNPIAALLAAVYAVG